MQCGPGNMSCDYSFTCEFHQAEIDKELEKEEDKRQRKEIIETLKDLTDKVGKIAEILQRKVF